MNQPANTSNPEQRYRDTHSIRVLGGMAVSLLLLVGAVKLWPIPGDYAPTDLVYTTLGPETIQIEEILQTTQQRRTPPPPAPLPPIIYPDDEIIEEVELDFSDSYLPIDEPGLEQELTPGDPIGAPTSMPAAETAPKVVRVSYPEYTRAARKKKIRAEVVVEALIDAKGRVKESKIVERFLLGKNEDDPKQPVDELGYGLEEAFQLAASRWFFRPARKNGVPVQSYHRFTLTVGI